MIKRVLIVLSLLFSSHVAISQQPMNMEQVRQEIIHYYDTGEYQQELRQATGPAKQYLLQRVAKNQQLAQPEKLAIVFDIDETVLSNYEFMKKMRFGGTIKMFDQAVRKVGGTAIRPTRELYNLAIKNQVAVFFITGRKENLRVPTEQNLRKEGFHQWQELRLKPVDFKADSASTFKIAQRQLIQQQGYDIILNVGDQESDLKGGFADKLVKLPDPFYYIN